MANSILVLGFTGQGKTTSIVPNEKYGIKGLNPKKTFFISVTNKPLGYRGWQKDYTLWTKENQTGNFYVSDNSQTIVQLVNYIINKRPEIKNIVIDDFHYIMIEENMAKISEKTYDKFNVMAKNMFDLIKLSYNLPMHINLIFMAHPEIEDKQWKLKTVGKLVDKTSPEGYFTYILCSSFEYDDEGKPKYGFYTKNFLDIASNNRIIAKSPIGIFEEGFIPNDMGYVVEEIEKFNKGE